MLTISYRNIFDKGKNMFKKIINYQDHECFVLDKNDLIEEIYNWSSPIGYLAGDNKKINLWELLILEPEVFKGYLAVYRENYQEPLLVKQFEFLQALNDGINLNEKLIKRQTIKREGRSEKYYYVLEKDKNYTQMYLEKDYVFCLLKLIDIDNAKEILNQEKYAILKKSITANIIRREIEIERVIESAKREIEEIGNENFDEDGQGYLGF